MKEYNYRIRVFISGMMVAMFYTNKGFSKLLANQGYQAAKDINIESYRAYEDGTSCLKLEVTFEDGKVSHYEYGGANVSYEWEKSDIPEQDENAKD